MINQLNIPKMWITVFILSLCKRNCTLCLQATPFFKSAPGPPNFFSWIELQGLFRFCLIHRTIIILRHILYFVYMCPCLGLDRYIYIYIYISNLRDLFFNFQAHLNRRTCFFYVIRISSVNFWMLTLMKKANNFQIAWVQPQGVA